MYCQSCGTRLESSAAFCHACGKPTKAAQGGPPENIVIDLSSLSRVASYTPNWRLVSGVAGGVALLSFFMPWMIVTSVVSYSSSGFDFAVGPTVQTLLGPQRGQPGPAMWLYVLGVISISGCAARLRTTKAAAVSVMVLAVLGLLLLLLIALGLGLQQQLFARVDIGFGLWLSILAMIAAAAGGLLGLRPELLHRASEGWTPAPGEEIRLAVDTRLRQRPGLWSPPEGAVSASTLAAILAVEADRWLQVRTEDGHVGFVPMSAVRPTYAIGSNRPPPAGNGPQAGEASVFKKE